MIITGKHLHRRTFLRGIGATIALPFLDSMVPAFGGRAEAAAAGIKRLAVAYVPNGIQMEKWTPAAASGGFDLTPTLEPLAPFHNRLTIVTGLANRPAFPATGEGTSVSTLSVEISRIASSRATVSPGCLIQRTTVPSATLSPIWGMFT